MSDNPPTTRPSDLRRSLRWVMQAWIFGAAWMYIVTGAALTQFAKQLHLPNFGFGLLAAMPFAGALFQLPVSYIIERYGYRKRFFIIIGIIHRGMWGLVALVPWVLPSSWGWAALLFMVGLSWVFGQMTLPVWVSWMADLVPPPIRGRYFSLRSRTGQVIGMIVTVVIGYVLDHAVNGQAMLKTLSIAFSIAGLAGSIDFLFFLAVPAVRQPQPNPGVSLWNMLREPLADRNFRRFLGFTATLTFATGYVGQFAWLYLFDVARISNTQANVMLVFVPLVIFIMFYPIWGRLVDRLGRKPVLLIAGVLIVPGSIGWIFVTHDHWFWGYLGVLLVTAAWPGIDLANFNILLSLADAAPSGARKSTGYVAVNSALGAVAGVLSGLFGGAVAQGMKDWQGMIFGWPLTYHGVLFIISGGLRLLALAWLTDLEDGRAHTTQAALRYMGTNLYSNLQQTIYIPGRFLSQLSRWTYKINPRGPRNSG
jgi:MFS family permease